MSRSIFRTKFPVLPIALALALLTGGGTLASVMLGSVPVAQAQDAPASPPPAGGGHQRIGQILKTLNLSDAQKAQVRAIVADARKQNTNITDREQRRANMKAAIGKIDSVLTPGQRTQWHAKLAAMRQQNAAGHAQ